MKKELPIEPKFMEIILEDGTRVQLENDKCVLDKETGKMYCLKKDKLIIVEEI